MDEDEFNRQKERHRRACQASSPDGLVPQFWETWGDIKQKYFF